jgi:DNA helicase II / ATP-dependent DNA helicase PcrA
MRKILMNIKLDKHQMKAVNTNYRNVLVVASPGSGKTTVIINRVAYLVEETGVGPGNIIVITFTRAAAQNMKQRYKAMSRGGMCPFFGTFHALFYKILSRHLGKINIISSTEGHNIIKSVLLSFFDELNEEKIKEVLNNISLFKSGGLGIEEFSPDIDKNIFIECYNCYEKYKKERSLMDFDDLQISCKKLFEDNPRILGSYQKLFKYILVDEFQDCDSLQISILKLLNRDNSIFAVGDEDQCIYGFRGSRPECMVEFDRIFEDGKKLYLSHNYRSTNNIVGMSKELIKNNTMRNEKKIIAWRKENKEVKIIRTINEGGEADEIAAYIQKIRLLGEGYFKDNAILYRTNVECRSFIDAFIRKKIPFKLMDKEYNFFEHFICKDILAYLSLSIDNTERESFTRIINRPFRYISKSNIDKVKAYSYKENCFDILSTIEDIPVFQIKAINKLKKDVHYLNKMSLRSAVDFIITDIGYIDFLKEYSAKYKIDINELGEVLEEFKEASSQFKNIGEFLIHVDEVSKEIKNSKKSFEEDCVILSTIHGVKGMEFNNVFVVNCVEETLPHSSSIKDSIEEERRLMYVAITRAINNLFLYIPKTIRGKTREESRFIKECNTLKDNDISFGYSSGDKIVHRVYGEGKIIDIKDKEINIGFVDGETRRFDAIVLINNKLIEKVV